MKITDIAINRYDLPLTKPLAIGTETIGQRSGAIIFLTDDTGLTGYGETAPLPGLHTETLDRAISELKQIKKEICGIEVDREKFGFPDQLKSMCGSARLGIEMAVFNLLRQSGERVITSAEKLVKINGLIMAEDNILAEIENLIALGFSTIKVKVARRPIDQDIQTVRAIQKIINAKTRLRLDANRSWSLDEAIAFGNQIDTTAIEYIEEPLKNISDLPAFFKHTKIPVALDETIVEHQTDLDIDLKAIDAFILKPSLIGGLYLTAQLINLAQKNNKKACLSSTFQSSVTIEAFAAFAASMGTEDTPHGLDTAKWLAEDLFIKPLTIKNGSIKISQSPPPTANLRMDLLKNV